MGRNVIWISLVVFFCGLLGFSSEAWGQVVWYVDDDAAVGGNGRRWEDAFSGLQEALDAAESGSGDEIWVAEGEYKPTSDYGLGIGDRGRHFRMKRGVGIYGGFADVGEPGWGDRDPNMYETILSGDIGTVDYDYDNCYHVFYHPPGIYLFSTAILDGFTITDGRADSDPHDNGGGMLTEDGNPTVRNCVFRDNKALAGGGMANFHGGCPIVTNCMFIGNSDINSGGGGGMYNEDYSSPGITNCRFINNTAGGRGGGIYNDDSNPVIRNCLFSGNSAIGSGCGIFNDHSIPVITNCTFSGNLADRGGGMYNYYSDFVKVANCIFWGNSASLGGNEIYNHKSSVSLSHCDIAGGYPGSGNINADPLFVDASGGDFHLQNTSPCINAGDNSVILEATDFEGDPRILYDIVDMGVDEVFGDVSFSLDVALYPYPGAVTAVVLEPGGGVYPFGTEVAITVEAAEGFAFNCWSGDLTSNDNPVTIIMDSPKHVTARFTFLGNRLFVDAGAGGLNNGTSWADALVELQDGLAAANNGDEIWVAAGVYRPTSDYGLGSGKRGRHFRMKNGVGIYGGFPASGEAIWGDRDPNMYETILSGDLLSNDNPATPVEDLYDDPCRIDNCYLVFYHPVGLGLDTSAVLDGFIIAAGNSVDDRSGGGMHNVGCSPNVNNCIFTRNTANREGGGMYNKNSNPFVENCIFESNMARYGGGVYNRDYSSPTVTNCIFIDNSSVSGGGMYNRLSSPKITGCSFVSNLANELGGGMLNSEGSITVQDCSFIGNSARLRGGGMFNGGSHMIVTRCIFNGNSSDHGGGMYNNSSSPTLISCTFTGNSAVLYGGGLYNYSSNPSLLCCTFSGNTSDGGGGMANQNSSCPDVTNCILWGDTAFSGSNEILNQSSSVPVISYCDIAGCLNGGTWVAGLGTDGGGNIDADPRFVDADGGDNIFGTEDDNLRLQAISVCIGAGDNSAITELLDLDGKPRFVGKVDMGAYEHQGDIYTDHIIYVDKGATSGGNSGTSWADAYISLQYAFFAVIGEPNEIWVAAGTYYPSFDYRLGTGTRGKHFCMINGVEIYGGFAGTETLLEQRDWRSNETILSGDIGLADYVSDNCYHVFYHPAGLGLDDSAVLDGFTITAGNANGTGNHDEGGGMYNFYNHPKVSHCTFRGNRSIGALPNPGLGGGMSNFYSHPTVMDCAFNSNTAHSIGGGMYNFISHPKVINCVFSGNYADYGGGMYNNDHSSPAVTGCIFSGNSADYGGGMMNATESSPTVADCVFIDNQTGANGYGGGIYNSGHSSPTVTGGIFVGNRSDYGGGVVNRFESHAEMRGCVFSGNSGVLGGGLINMDDSQAVVTGCTFWGNSADDGGGMLNYLSSPTVQNGIFWGNAAGAGAEILNYDASSIPVIGYCDIAGSGGSGAGWDTTLGIDAGGNIDADPAFVDAGGGDFHLQSEVGRWDAVSGSWVVDGAHSPGIDAGDPNVDWVGELWPHGGRVNMGAYGGTAEASMSLSLVGNVADLNGDGAVDLVDWGLLGEKWVVEQVLLKADLDRDGVVGLLDLWRFGQEWLWGK